MPGVGAATVPTYFSLTPTNRSGCPTKLFDVLSVDAVECAIEIQNAVAARVTQPGEPAAVTATVQCTISLSDLALPGIPGSDGLKAEFTSHLDIYRSR